MPRLRVVSRGFFRHLTREILQSAAHQALAELLGIDGAAILPISVLPIVQDDSLANQFECNFFLSEEDHVFLREFTRPAEDGLIEQHFLIDCGLTPASGSLAAAIALGLAHRVSGVIEDDSLYLMPVVSTTPEDFARALRQHQTVRQIPDALTAFWNHAMQARYKELRIAESEIDRP